MLGNTNGAHTRPTPTVRNAKSLVQIQVADVRADITGPAETDLCVQIRAIHVHLAAVGVNNLANLLDGFFKHAMG